ncbi:MAG: hypothetical protein ACYTXF_00320 [Nostoc sp.]
MDWLEYVTEIRKTCNVPASARNIAIAIWVDVQVRNSVSVPSVLSWRWINQ